MKNNFSFLFLIAILLFYNENAFAQLIGRSSNGSAPGKEVAPQAINSGSLSGDVNLFTGTYNTSYSLGTVSTLSGLSFTANLSYNSSFSSGDNAPNVSGIAYGEGWSLDIPMINVSIEDYNKYSPNQMENLNPENAFGLQKTPIFTKYLPNDPTNCDEAKEEGRLYWYAPSISIPGVVSGRMVYKQQEVTGSGVNAVTEYVFVLNRFEQYIEARLNMSTYLWTVTTEDGTQYKFKYLTVNHRNPSNQRVQFECQDPASMKNLIFPKTEITAWYCDEISHPNHTDKIKFDYKVYGKFDFFKVFRSNWGTQVNTYVPNTDATNMLPVTGKDVFISRVFSTSDGVNVSSSELKFNYDYIYNTDLVTANASNVPDIENSIKFDDLYAKMIYKTDPLSATTTSVSLNNWKRYNHVRSDEVDTGCSRLTDVPLFGTTNNLNPYLASKFLTTTNNNGFLNYKLTSDGKLNHGYLESPRITTPEIVAGDIYDLQISINNAGSFNCLFDVNLATGGTGNEPSSVLTHNSNTVINADCNKNKSGESLFTTFNQAVKWGAGSGGSIITSNIFQMPNIPHSGFSLQVGPANSDNLFGMDFTEIPFLANLGGTCEGYINHLGSSSAAEKDRDVGGLSIIKSGGSIPYNFGIGAPWYMLQNIRGTAAPFIQPFYGVFGNCSAPSQWWNDLKTKTGTNICNNSASWNNLPTRATENTQITKVDLIRYGKFPYILKTVEFSVKNKNQALVKVSKLDLSYIVKKANVFTTTTNQFTNVEQVCTSSKRRNVILLSSIMQVAADGTLYPSNLSATPTTKFSYTAKNPTGDMIAAAGSLSGCLSGAYGLNGYFWVLNTIENPLGGITSLEYSKISPQSNTLIGTIDVTPNEQSYYSTSFAYRLRPSERRVPTGFDDCPVSDPLQQPINKLGKNSAIQVFFVVNKKTVTDQNGTLKTWEYIYDSLANSYIDNVFFASNLKYDDGFNNVKAGFGYTKIKGPFAVVATAPISAYHHLTNQLNVSSVLWGKPYLTLNYAADGTTLISSQSMEYTANIVFDKPWKPSGATAIAHPNFPNIPSSTATKFITFDMPYFYETKFESSITAYNPNYLKSFFIKLVKSTSKTVETGGNNVVVKEYSYFDAQKNATAGNNSLITIASNGYEALLGLVSGTTATLTFEPSWQTFKVKTYSSEYGPTSTTPLFTQEEHFYLYDLANVSAYQTSGAINTGFKNIHFAFNKKMRNVEFETRTTNKSTLTSTTTDPPKVTSTNVVYKKYFETMGSELTTGKLLPASHWVQVLPQANHPVTTFDATFKDKVTWAYLRTDTITGYYDKNLAPTDIIDVLGLLTKRTYNQYTGQMTTEVIGSGLSDFLTTTNLYGNDNTLTSVTYPNNLVFSYVYDRLKRPIQAFRNGNMLQRTYYSQNNGQLTATATFLDRTKKNFVRQTNFTTATDTFQIISYLDPLGRPAGTVKDGYLVEDNIYDIWDRPLYKLKPSTGTNPITTTPLSTTLLEHLQFQYEAAPRSRVLKSAKYGQDITLTTSKTTNAVYEIITSTALQALLTAAGQTAALPVGTKFMSESMTDEDGKKTQVITNLFGQKVVTISGAGSTTDAVATVYLYGDAGQPVKVTNPKGQVTEYFYNYAGMMFKKTTPDDGTTLLAYNRAGQLVADKNGLSEIRIYTYDTYGRMTEQNFLSGTNAPAVGDVNNPFVANGLPWLVTTNNFNSLVTNTNIRKEKAWIYNNASATNALFSSTIQAWVTSGQNALGRLAQATSFDLSGNPINIKLLKYNNDGFFSGEITLFNEVALTSTSANVLTKIDYPSYNLMGNLLKQNIDLGFDNVLDLQYANTYDKRNRMTNVYVSYLDEGTAGRRIASYTYDDATDLMTNKKFYDRNPGGGTAQIVDNISYNYLTDKRYRLTSMKSNFFEYYLAYDGNQVTSDGTATGTAITTGNTLSTNYNGNINSTYANYKLSGLTAPANTFNRFTAGSVYTYTYDALNRLTNADALIGVNHALASITTNGKIFGDNTFTFDKVGNILTTNIGLFDVGFATATLKKFQYNYLNSNNNFLTTINDVTTSTSTLDRTLTSDAIGRQIKDSKRTIEATTYRPSNLTWAHTVGTSLTVKAMTYLYDHTDKRIFKKNIQGPVVATSEYYIHNVYGQEIAIYDRKNNVILNWYVQGAREREARFINQRTAGNTGGGFKSSGDDSKVIYTTSAQTTDVSRIRYPVNLVLVGDTAGNPLGYLLEPEMEEDAQELQILQRITIAKPEFQIFCTDTLGTDSRVVTLRDVLAIRATGERFYLEGYRADCAKPRAEESGSVAPNIIDPFFYIYDHLGNTRLIYSPNLVSSSLTHTFDYAADYSPYGRILRSAGSLATPERYLSTQHERDVETGYDNRGARLYDSEIGRFISIDPMAGKFAAWSPYNYVMGNPILMIDPSGMAPEEIIIKYRANKDDNNPITVRYSTDVKLYDTKTGKEYTGDNQYILSTKSAIDFISNSGEGPNGVISDLVGGEETHLVSNVDLIRDGTKNEENASYNIASRFEGNPKGSFTKFVPDADRIRLNENYSGADILSHEFKHAYNRKNGLLDLGNSGQNSGVRNEEIDAINFQNIIRDKEGKDPRIIFGGVDVSKDLTPVTLYKNYKK
jgi:RHS repeat-associated protein